jgi:hypothetical protein
MSVINYNNKYFPNAEWAASKSVDEFVEHEKHVGLTDAELREAHELCVASIAPAAEAKAVKKAKEPKIDAEK